MIAREMETTKAVLVTAFMPAAPKARSERGSPTINQNKESEMNAATETKLKTTQEDVSVYRNLRKALERMGASEFCVPCYSFMKPGHACPDWTRRTHAQTLRGGIRPVPRASLALPVRAAQDRQLVLLGSGGSN